MRAGSNLEPPQPYDPAAPGISVLIGGAPCDFVPVLSTPTKIVCRTRPYRLGNATFAHALDGVTVGPLHWDAHATGNGCESGRVPVSVRIGGLGGDITGSWNAASRKCQRGDAEKYCK